MLRNLLSCLKKATIFLFAIATLATIGTNPAWANPALSNSIESNSLEINSAQTLIALPIVKNIFAGNAPQNIGVKDGLLSSCPESPNCVVSQKADEEHLIVPIAYQGDLEQAKETLLKVLTVVPGTEVIEQNENYILAQSTSRLMGFIDDVEFYFPTDKKEIEMRSASRLGESDLGVNRRRLEQIRFAMADLQA